MPFSPILPLLFLSDECILKMRPFVREKKIVCATQKVIFFPPFHYYLSLSFLSLFSPPMSECIDSLLARILDLKGLFSRFGIVSMQLLMLLRFLEKPLIWIISPYIPGVYKALSYDRP